MDLTESPQDAEHLRLLALFHKIYAIFVAIFACLPILHLAAGLFVLFGEFAPPKEGPEALWLARMVGGFFVVLSITFIISGWTLAVCLFLAADRLSQRRGFYFCFGVAIATIFLSGPVGAVLGLCTLLVLHRPAVKEAFLAHDAKKS